LDLAAATGSVYFEPGNPPSLAFMAVLILIGMRGERAGNICDAEAGFEIRAEWDGEAGVWWCSNDELPLTTEAPTFEELVARVLEIAPEIAAENGLAAPGGEIELHVIAKRVEAVPVIAAA